MADDADSSADLTSPAERRRARVRESILDAAERVFAAEGEAGLSIRRLAEEIDYSPAAIYKYFGSKADLVEELKQAFFERFLARMETVTGSEAPFLDKAVEGMATYVRTAIERPHHYVAAFSGEMLPEQAPEASPENRDHFALSPAGQAFNHLEEMVGEGIREGFFDPGMHANTAANSIWASCHGLSLLMIHLPCFPNKTGQITETEQDAFIRAHASLLVAGLRNGSAKK